MFFYLMEMMTKLLGDFEVAQSGSVTRVTWFIDCSFSTVRGSSLSTCATRLPPPPPSRRTNPEGTPPEKWFISSASAKSTCQLNKWTRGANISGHILGNPYNYFYSIHKSARKSFKIGTQIETMLFQPAPSSLSPVGSYQSQDSVMEKSQPASSK